MFFAAGIALLVIISAPITYAQSGRSAVALGASVSPATTSKRGLEFLKKVGIRRKASVSRIAFPYIDFGVIAPGAVAERSFPLNGAEVGQQVDLMAPRAANVGGAKFVAWVSARGFVTVRSVNTGAMTQNLGPGQVYRVRLR